MQDAYYQEAMVMKSFEYLNRFSVQKEHKAVRAGK